MRTVDPIFLLSTVSLTCAATMRKVKLETHLEINAYNIIYTCYVSDIFN